jgi:hypothetical protein
MPEDILQKSSNAFRGEKTERHGGHLAILWAARYSYSTNRFWQWMCRTPKIHPNVSRTPEWTALFISHEESLAHIADEQSILPRTKEPQ